MGDEQVGQAELGCCRSWSRLTTCAWTDTSSADTGSSATMKSGSQRQSAGDADPLALAAGERVWVAVGGVPGGRTIEQLATRSRGGGPWRPRARRAARRRSRARSCAGSAWRTGPGTRPAACAAAAGAGLAGVLVMSSPSKRIEPATGRCDAGSAARWWSCPSRSRRRGPASRRGDGERHVVDGVDELDVRPRTGAADREADRQVARPRRRRSCAGAPASQARGVTLELEGRQQARPCRPRTSSSPGIASRHCVTASEHRGRERAPDRRADQVGRGAVDRHQPRHHHVDASACC